VELNRDIGGERVRVEVLDHLRLVEAGAARIAQACALAVEERGRCLLALSGGGTPGPVYELLASPRFDSVVPWESVHLLWGDDRAVPPDHEASNYLLVEKSGLLDRRLGGVHRMRGELPPEQGAAEYEAVLRTLAGGAAPAPGSPSPSPERPLVMDLALNGMGDDGHTASLFPGTPQLEERERWVISTDVQQGYRRLSMTLPLFWAAREVLFLIEGENKAQLLRDVLSRERPDLPTARLLSQIQAATLLLDPGAASSLESLR
jgi:6-phosphogluconolactonase